MERFFSKVNKTDNCWEWTASLIGCGYGNFKYKGKRYAAHRFSWELVNGKIPDGLLVCHKCDNRKCVNPEHLFLGTQKDNMQDCLRKGRLVLSFNRIPKNRVLKDPFIIEKIKKEIKNRTCSLKQLSTMLGYSESLLKSISCGRCYNNPQSPLLKIKQNIF